MPVVQRLRERFGIAQVCIVADRGMISAATIAALEKAGLAYILGDASENDIRAFVTKRKISGGTVSDRGRDARDIMRTSRAPMDRRWASSATARTIVRTLSRWCGLVE